MLLPKHHPWCRPWSSLPIHVLLHIQSLDQVHAQSSELSLLLIHTSSPREPSLSTHNPSSEAASRVQRLSACPADFGHGSLHHLVRKSLKINLSVAVSHTHTHMHTHACMHIYYWFCFTEEPWLIHLGTQQRAWVKPHPHPRWSFILIQWGVQGVSVSHL